MIIHVTAQHIADAQKGTRACPIAVALQDAGFQNPNVGYWTASSASENGYHKLSDTACQFIRDWEAGRVVESFSFELGEIQS